MSAVTFPAFVNLFFFCPVFDRLEKDEDCLSLFEVLLIFVESLFLEKLSNLSILSSCSLLNSNNFSFNNVITFIHLSFSFSVFALRINSLSSNRNLNIFSSTDSGNDICSRLN